MGRYCGSKIIELQRIVVVGISDRLPIVKKLVVGKALYTCTSFFGHIVTLTQCAVIGHNGTKGGRGRTISIVETCCSTGTVGSAIVVHNKVVSNLMTKRIVTRGADRTDN
jgi:hypothetical protein